MELKATNTVMRTSLEQPNNDYLDFVGAIDFLRRYRVNIAMIAVPIFLLGALYAFMAPSVYQANLLIKIDVNDPSQRNNLSENLTGIFDLKTAAAAELEMLRSRSVVTRAVESARLYIDAQPKYLPWIGTWLEIQNNEESSNPESIQISRFDVPDSLEKKLFKLTLDTPTTFTLHYAAKIVANNSIGQELTFSEPDGDVLIKVDSITASPGKVFNLRRLSMGDAVEKLQKNLIIAEKGKQSGLISVSLEDTKPALAARVLNEIGKQYMAQNIKLKTEEAEKQLVFLNTQLPEIKSAIETAEARFSSFRNSRGTTDLNEDVKAILQQSVQSQLKLVELRQRQDELRTRYQDENPLVQAVSQQIRTVSNEIANINEKIKRVPGTEQDLVRLTRDVKVNTDLYASLLATAQQLRLVKESTVGSARLIDTAVRPSTPIGPKRLLIMLGAAAVGLLLGLIWAYVCSVAKRSIDSPNELAKTQGIPISAVVPHSKTQINLHSKIMSRTRGVNLLSDQASEDGAVESLRTFRTALDFAKESARNNIIAITGPTASLGKSFIAANLAALLASSGKRVLLIDADLRDGYLHRYLGIDRPLGMAELLAEQVMLPDVTHLNVINNLDFISTGELRARPADELAKKILKVTLDKVAPRYDFVIVDTAPVLVGADALIVSSHAGMVFCIARQGMSRADHLTEALNRFAQSGISVNGLIFNDAKPTDLAYGYEYARHVGKPRVA